MYINQEKANKIITIICLITIFLLIFFIAKELYQTKDYIKTEATIIEHIKKIDIGIQNNSKSSTSKYVKVKHNNYIITYRVWTFLFKEEGSTTTIHYSKKNPNIIRDKFKITTEIMGIAFLSLFVLGLNLSKKNQNNLKENNNINPKIRF